VAAGVEVPLCAEYYDGQLDRGTSQTDFVRFSPAVCKSAALIGGCRDALWGGTEALPFLSASQPFFTARCALLPAFLPFFFPDS
jgi:hypothetical protein